MNSSIFFHIIIGCQTFAISKQLGSKNKGKTPTSAQLRLQYIYYNAVEWISLEKYSKSIFLLSLGCLGFNDIWLQLRQGENGTGLTESLRGWNYSVWGKRPSTFGDATRETITRPPRPQQAGISVPCHFRIHWQLKLATREMLTTKFLIPSLTR